MFSIKPTSNSRQQIILIFFILFFLLGMAIFKDYGISWDEPRSRLNGYVTLNFIVNRDPLLFSYEDRHYGSIFETFLFAVEKIMFFSGDLRSIYFMRHFFTFSFFYVAVIFFFFLIKKYFRDWRFGLLGCLFLILSPRIFAHSFYNSKDLPFLSIFIIAIFTLINLLKKPKIKNSLVHAFTSALLIDIRIVGVILPILTLIFRMGNVFWPGNGKRKIKFGIVASYLLALTGFVILFWPLLWQRSLYHFLSAFKQMANFPWQNEVLYRGEYFLANNLPWHYVPVWLGITTPPLYLFIFILGTAIIVKRFINNPVSYYKKHPEALIFLAWFFLPLVAIWIVKPVLYDGFRQLFFIYPALLLIGLVGLRVILLSLKKAKKYCFKLAIVTLVCISLINTGFFMLKHHPHQNIYFNCLAGQNMAGLKNQFELDYWGLSYRQALEFILQNDKRQQINIMVANEPGKINALIVKNPHRLNYVDEISQADYFLSNFRWQQQDYPYKNEFYSIKINETKVMVVYRLK